jgi:hypothetical protein
MAQENKSPLGLLLIVGVVAFVLINKQPSPKELDVTPRRELLSVVVNAFAYNLEKDGESSTPTIKTTVDLAAAFNTYGNRTVTGQAYTTTFADVFKELGLGIKAAAEETDVVRNMDDKVASGQTVRQAIVSYLKKQAEKLK